MPPCPFCTLPSERIVLANALAVVVRDAYPVASGHTLVIPRRHVGSWFDLDAAEREAVMDLLGQARDGLLQRAGDGGVNGGAAVVDGFNIGINDGPAAGQTVPHVHVHLIPRRRGDSADPRGGVRWVLPERADYWSGRKAEG